jgi:phosphatidylglycerophosphate synthase
MICEIVKVCYFLAIFKHIEGEREGEVESSYVKISILLFKIFSSYFYLFQKSKKSSWWEEWIKKKKWGKKKEFFFFFYLLCFLFVKEMTINELDSSDDNNNVFILK